MPLSDGRNYRTSRSYHNLQRSWLVGDGRWGFPEILPQPLPDLTGLDWVSFNYAKTCKQPEDKVVHFFIDDYQFERVWSNPEAYLPLLRRFAAVVMPDFSVYEDFPLCLQLYNGFRNCWLARWWQESGLTVLPQIQALDDPVDGVTYFRDSLPKGGDYALSAVGSQADALTAARYDAFVDDAVEMLQPRRIYLYGTASEHIRSAFGGIIVPVQSFAERRRAVMRAEKEQSLYVS